MPLPVQLIVVLTLAIVFIVIATSRFNWHPFVVLVLACYGIGFGAGMDPLEIGSTIRAGFGGILSSIGLVILFGTMIGTILEKTGSAITMANTVLKVLGNRMPGLTMSIIGYLVSIPVFCASNSGPHRRGGKPRTE